MKAEQLVSSAERLRVRIDYVKEAYPDVVEALQVPDEYKEETDAAMNYGQGYAAAMLEVAEAELISATRKLDLMMRERGLEDLAAVKDFAASLHDRREGGEESKAKADGEGDPTTHVKPPRVLKVDAAEPTPLDKVREEYQRFYDYVADLDPSVIDAWHFQENVRVQEEARRETDQAD